MSDIGFGGHPGIGGIDPNPYDDPPTNEPTTVPEDVPEPAVCPTCGRPFGEAGYAPGSGNVW